MDLSCNTKIKASNTKIQATLAPRGNSPKQRGDDSKHKDDVLEHCLHDLRAIYNSIGRVMMVNEERKHKGGCKRKCVAVARRSVRRALEEAQNRAKPVSNAQQK